jgi:uncharacterized protein
MSDENVEIVRRHLETFMSGDREAALAAYHPDVEFDATVRPEGAVYRGRDGVDEAMRVWIGTWDDWKVEFQQFLDAGDRVLVVSRESGRGKGSGIEIDQAVYALFTLRDGMIVRWEAFLDRPEALDAAGLSE